MKNNVNQRRQQLRRQRQLSTLQYWWRLILISGICSAIISLFLSPLWSINKPEQVEIKGNKYLANETIKKILNIKYPQPVMAISPAQFNNKLIANGAFAKVETTRQLIPPKITINLIDLPPVALVQQAKNSEPIGLITYLGGFFAINNYQNIELPKLKLLINQTPTCPYWSEIYLAATQSKIPINTIDCIDPLNIYLQTDIGKVYIGSYSDQLPKQIKILEQLQNLQKQTDPEQVEYIDLENPDFPKVQLKQTSKPPSPTKPSKNQQKSP